MKILNDSHPWMTITMMGIVLIVAVVGGAVVIWGNPGTLSFEAYVETLKNLAYGIAALGVGRGIVSAVKKNGGGG